MSSVRVACLVLIACLGVAAYGSVARADVPPHMRSGRPHEPSGSSGPFRSCGSGIGTGFAGIGLAWAAIWAGNHFARRVRRK